MQRITIFGAAGYIGSALVDKLQKAEREIISISRANYNDCMDDLGHAVYAIGLTSDFRDRTLETVDAHVTKLNLLLEKRFDSFTYLSSTRLYKSRASTRETSPISVSPLDFDDIYTLSKLLGEALVLRMAPGRGRVCRLSNVYGGNDQSSNFLTSVISDARNKRRVRIMQSPASEKDYIHIDDACRAIEEVALRGSESIYNVASGENTSHQDIADALTREGISIEFVEKNIVQFKSVDVKRLQKLMDWHPRRLVNDIVSLLNEPQH